MERSDETLVYKQAMSRQEMGKMVSAIGLPVAIFALGAVSICNLSSLGSYVIAPLSAAMWMMGLFVAIALPSHRRQAVNMTLGFCAGYYAGTLGLKIVMVLLSGLSSEMLSASLNITMATSAGNTMIGLISNVLAVLSVMVPITFLVAMGKMFVQFRRNRTLQDAFTQATGLRRSGKRTGRRM